MLCNCYAKGDFAWVVRHLLGKTEGEFEEKLLDGRALLFSRNGIFQVRLYKGKRQYIYKSLKTRDLIKARDLAVRAHHELEFSKALLHESC